MASATYLEVMLPRRLATRPQGYRGSTESDMLSTSRKLARHNRTPVQSLKVPPGGTGRIKGGQVAPLVTTDGGKSVSDALTELLWSPTCAYRVYG